MRDEFEVISHRSGDYKVFFINLLYRTPHLHKELEVCLLLEGSVQLLVPGRTETRKQGDLWVMNPYESHELAADRPALILSLQVSPAFFSSVFPQMESMEFVPPGTCRGEAAAPLREMLLRIAAAYFSPEETAPLRCAGLIHLFFSHLLTTLPCSRVSEKERQSSVNRAQRIRTIVDYIDLHYGQKLLLTDLAEELGLTMNYLSASFKSVFGMSFQAYVMKKRCEKARQLLLLTDFSLLDISIACGFSDVKYFNQGFQRQFGCSPRQYRLDFRQEGQDQQQESMLTTQEFLSPAASRSILGTYLHGEQ